MWEELEALEDHADSRAERVQVRVRRAARRRRRRVISPLSIRSRPLMHRMSVLLPEPDGPQTTTTEPFATDADAVVEDAKGAERLRDVANLDHGCANRRSSVAFTGELQTFDSAACGVKAVAAEKNCWNLLMLGILAGHEPLRLGGASTFTARTRRTLGEGNFVHCSDT